METPKFNICFDVSNGEGVVIIDDIIALHLKTDGMIKGDVTTLPQDRIVEMGTEFKWDSVKYISEDNQWQLLRRGEDVKRVDVPEKYRKSALAVQVMRDLIGNS